MNKKLKEKIAESLIGGAADHADRVDTVRDDHSHDPGAADAVSGGCCLLIVGMGFFTLGADMAMMPIGEYVGGRSAQV